MKRSKKENIKVAKNMFKDSLDKGLLNRAKIQPLIARVKLEYKSSALAVLKEYLKIVERYQKSQMLFIEISSEIQDSSLKEIRKTLEKRFHKSLQIQVLKNPSLIAGLKVTLDDTQWDYSLKNRLEQMKEVISG